MLLLVNSKTIPIITIIQLTFHVPKVFPIPDSGYFMKFDTSSGAAGSSALLESRILYPKRDGQCLQFFYKMTGAAGDKLVIWIRTDDGTGTVRSVRKIHTIAGILFLSFLRQHRITIQLISFFLFFQEVEMLPGK